MTQPFAPPSTPRGSQRVPSTPPSTSPPVRAAPSVPYGPPAVVRASEEEHPTYSPRDHPPSRMIKHPQASYQQQQYMQQYHPSLREQQMMEQHMFEQREMLYREQEQQYLREQEHYLREQHHRDRDPQYELHEHLREQQQRLMHPYHYEQYISEHLHRRGNISEPPYVKVKREAPSDYPYPEHKLSVREQLKMNLLQREPGVGEGSYARPISTKGLPPSPPSLHSPSSKHSSGFTQHMFAVPTSPSSAPPSLSPTSYVPSTPKQAFTTSQAPPQTHFDSTKFTNYTSQEFQQLSSKSSTPTPPLPTQSATPPSILSANSGKWTAWENEKDVYKQAKLLSESLQSNVKSFLEATGTPGQTRTTPSTPTSPSLTIQRAPGSLSLPPGTSSSTPASSSGSTRVSPRASSQTSTTGKRKASADANTTPAKAQALTPAQQEFQKEALLFSSKDIRAGVTRMNTMLSNANLLDIYNKFQRADEYSQYCTKSHQPSSSSPSTSATITA
eukprot:Phypoly_transcript_05553.p1 GENE.Phypoly_transcript_05553~~Phypoly_transcript_05553.p1  ORF type:complete len:565 (-),score=126.17 Phypoly_transcript_05553:248-1750(-)